MKCIDNKLRITTSILHIHITKIKINFDNLRRSFGVGKKSVGESLNEVVYGYFQGEELFISSSLNISAGLLNQIIWGEDSIFVEKLFLIGQTLTKS